MSGEIRMVLHGGHIAVNGRRSAESLYDFNLATYDEGDTLRPVRGEGLRARARPVVQDRRQRDLKPVTSTSHAVRARQVSTDAGA